MKEKIEFQIEEYTNEISQHKDMIIALQGAIQALKRLLTEDEKKEAPDGRQNKNKG